MRHVYRASIVGLIVLISCNSAKTPSNATFAKAISDYLAKHGEACTVFQRQFPADIPRSEQSEKYGIAGKLSALEQAGLVHASDATAEIRGLLSPLRGSEPAQPVRRYELTESGKTYFQRIVGIPGQPNGFCYGRKSVDTIVKWTEPAAIGSSTQAEVTYTYKITDAAPWAQRSDVQGAFSDIRDTMNGDSKTAEIVGVQLTSNGWEVSGQ